MKLKEFFENFDFYFDHSDVNIYENFDLGTKWSVSMFRLREIEDKLLISAFEEKDLKDFLSKNGNRAIRKWGITFDDYGSRDRAITSIILDSEVKE